MRRFLRLKAFFVIFTARKVGKLKDLHRPDPEIHGFSVGNASVRRFHGEGESVKRAFAVPVRIPQRGRGNIDLLRDRISDYRTRLPEDHRPVRVGNFIFRISAFSVHREVHNKADLRRKAVDALCVYINIVNVGSAGKYKRDLPEDAAGDKPSDPVP